MKSIKSWGIRVKGTLAAMIIMIGSILVPAQPAQAAVWDISINSFIKLLSQAANLPANSSTENPYIEAAVNAGIVKPDDFANLNSKITRTDAAVLLNRADEYLHGDTVDQKLLNFVLDKRISDINKIPEAKRTEVAKIFAKGIIKGYSNGYYIQNRQFRGSSYITASAAKSMIKLVVNPEKRAKISPDGMLIRTTNLPKNADKYEYILDCYPNKFYERKFEFMWIDGWKTSSYNNYCAYPVEMRKGTFKNWYDQWPLSTEMDKHLYKWADMAEKYLQYIFNVDYSTVNEEWIEGLGALFVSGNRNEADDIRTYYIEKMKENKVKVESSIIAVEPSTFYQDDSYCMRAYVRYRITAKDMSVKQSKLIYSQYPALDNLKSGEWREGIFDIRFGTNNGSSGDGSDFAIDIMTHFVDAYNVPIQ